MRTWMVQARLDDGRTVQTESGAADAAAAIVELSALLAKQSPIVGLTVMTSTEWRRQLVDAGGVAVEDLAAADLNGDGRIDIVAVGRATGNVRIYWNEGAK